MVGPLRIYAAIVEPSDGDMGRLADDLVAFGIYVIGQGETIDVVSVFDEAPKLSLLLVDDSIGTHVGGAVIAHAKFLRPDVPVLWISSGDVTLAGFRHVAPDAVVARPVALTTLASIAAARLRASWYGSALVEALAASVDETFRTTFGMSVDFTDAFLKASASTAGPVHAVVPFASATSSGRLALSGPERGFVSIYRAMIPEGAEPSLDLLRDVAAEVLNRLYGRYKEWSCGHGVLPHAGTPTCMAHDDFLRRYRGGQPAVGLEFETGGGTFLFELSLDHFDDVFPVPLDAEVVARPSGALLYL